MKTHYKVVCNSDHEELESSLEYWLERGWKLVGGLSVSFQVMTAFYSQAVCKKIKKPRKKTTKARTGVWRSQVGK